MPSPSAPDLALPLWGQIVAALAFIGGAFGVVRNAWKSEPKHDASSDAVVISGAFADAQPMRELVLAVKEMTIAARDASEATARFDRNQGDRSRDLRDAMDDMKREQRITNEHLETIESVTGRGLRIVPAVERPPGA